MSKSTKNMGDVKNQLNKLEEDMEEFLNDNNLNIMTTTEQNESQVKQLKPKFNKVKKKKKTLFSRMNNKNNNNQSKLSETIKRTNQETQLVVKDFDHFVKSIDKRQMTNIAEVSKREKNKIKEERRLKCLKKKLDDEIKLKIESQNKRVRDNVYNYVRKMYLY